jgi:hypothetical protein
VLGRLKGLVLAMLAPLRVAPVPLRALDPPSALGSPNPQVGSEEWSFSLTKECFLIVPSA